MPNKRQSTASTRSRTTRSKSQASAKSTSARGAKTKSAAGRAQTKSASHRPATKTVGKTRAAGAAKSKTATARKPSPRSQNLSRTTTDHEEIRRWAEERGAHPACVRRTGRAKGDVGMIRLDFPGFTGEQSLQPISWDEFFEAFDDNQLALVYQEKTARGQKSNFNKLVSRANVE